MIFKKLVLKNFKSHIDTEIDFNKGITMILGDNGSGKSSIFEGINFALYKKYDTKSLNDLINTQSDNMSVSLSFLIGNKEYKVKRTRNQKKSTAQLFVLRNDAYQEIVSGDKEVNNYIEELIEIDADLFLNAIYIKQGEIDSLVTQRASERKKYISKLLRLENLEVSYKNIANIISNYELKKNQINNSIDNNVQDNKEDLMLLQKELKKQFTQENNTLSELQEDIASVTNDIQKENTKNMQYQQLNNQKIQLQTEIDYILDNLNDLDKKMQDLKQYDSTLQDIDDLDKKIISLEKLLALKKDYDKIVDSKNMVQQAIDEDLSHLLSINDISHIYKMSDIIFKSDYSRDGFEKLSEVISQDLQETNFNLKKILDKEKQTLNQNNIVKNSLEINKKSLQELDSVDNVCPVCQSDISEEYKTKLIKNYQNTINDYQRKIAKIEQELNIIANERETLTQMEKDKQGFMNDLNQANLLLNSIDNQKKTLFNLHNDEDKILEQIDALQKQLNIENMSFVDITELYNDLMEKQKNLEKIKFILKDKENITQQYNDKTNDYQRKKQELDTLTNNIQNLNFDSSILQKLQRQQSDLQEKYYPLLKKVNEIENEIKYNDKQIYTLDEKIKKNQENYLMIKKINNFIIFLKKIRVLFSKDGLQKDIRLSFKPQIERYTQVFFEKFDFNYSNLRLSDDYDIIISGPLGNNNIDMVSGGEKIAISLSLRLGIAQAITANTIETILLDEPTIYLDDFRKQEFVNIIRSISLVPQMIIITHDPELENVADNVINVKKKNGCSILF